MEKSEILTGLKNSPDWHRPNKDSYWWKVAFDAYHKATGTRLSIGCGVCYKKVKEWLEK